MAKARATAAKDAGVASALICLTLGFAACARRPGDAPASGATASPSAVPSEDVAGAPAPRRDPWAAEARGPVEKLDAGAVIERRFASSTPHLYRLRLEADHYVRLAVEQHGVDVELRLTGPDGRTSVELDLSEGQLGNEDVAVVADQAGDCTLAVRPAGSHDTGSYVLRVASLRQARPEDRRRANAYAWIASAEMLRNAQVADGLQRAGVFYRRALDEWRALGAEREAALTLRRWGRALIDQDQLRQALETFQEALSIERRSGDRRQQAHALNDLVPVAHRVGVSDVGAPAHDALRLARAESDRFAEADALHNLGLLTASSGDAEGALAYYDAELALWRALGTRRHEAAALHAQGRACTLLGRFDEAKDLFEQALSIRRSSAHASGESATLLQLGWLRYLARDYEGALERYGQAFEVARRAGLDGDLPALLDRRASALLALGRRDEALAMYRDALERLRRAGSRTGYARTLSNIAGVHAEMREWDLAAREYDEAMRGLRAVRDLDALPSVLLDRAQMLRDRGEVERAERAVQSALDLLEQLRNLVGGEVSRATYLAARHKFFDFHVDLLMQREADEPGAGHATRAFEVTEQARARALLDDLAWSRRDPALDARTRAEDRELDARLDAAVATEQRLAEQDATGEQRSAAAADVAALLRAQDERRGRRRSAASRDAAWSSARPLGLAAIQRDVLDDDTLMVAYFLGEKRSFVWLVGRTSFEFQPLPPRDTIEALARSVYELVPRSRERGVRQQAALLSASLADVVLGPLRGRLGHKRLLLIGDGALHYVPFAALLVRPERPPDARETGSAWLDGRVPLVAEHELVTAPSASVLGHVRSEWLQRQPARHLLAVLADPVFERSDRRLGGAAVAPPQEPPAAEAVGDLERSASDVGLPQPRRLPYSRLEAEKILALVPVGQSLRALDFDASRETVLLGRLRDYRILHFATHGLLNARHPELSGLVLSRVDRDGHPQDGFLRVGDLYQLSLPADLVVLSACRTALGRDVRGEGLVGLTQAFLRAGAARVLVSLWNVNDRATADLMARFYDALLTRGMAPAAALRVAQLAFMRDRAFAAPAYWAGFTLQGDWREGRSGH